MWSFNVPEPTLQQRLDAMRETSSTRLGAATVLFYQHDNGQVGCTFQLLGAKAGSVDARTGKVTAAELRELATQANAAADAVENSGPPEGGG